MSAKEPKTYETVESRALRALAIHGRAPVELHGFNEGERTRLSELIDVKGAAVEGSKEKFDSVILDFHERMKATVDEESPTKPKRSDPPNADQNTT